MPHLRRIAGVVAALLLAAARLRAQQIPTQLPSSDEARRLLDARPDLAGQIRREIGSSGLTADQIRARLRAVGYPDDLLDAYLRTPPNARGGASSPLPNGDVLDAVAALGLSDSTDTSALREVLRARRGRDTTRAGRRPVDDATIDDASDATDARDSLSDGATLDSATASRTGPRRAAERRRLGLAASSDSGMTVFGLDVFRRATSQFDANLAGPVDGTYRLGAGDRVVLLITGDAEHAYTLDVTREGFIMIPGVGELSVANLTLAQTEDLLYQRLGRVFSGLRRGPSATTRFSLNVAKLHTNQVYVLGDVAVPGSYRVSSAGTALTALYAAGGPTPNGSLRRVEIRRANRIVDTLDLYDYLLRADGSHDPRLQSGDVVFVPVHGARVRVVGEVVRPATYELKAGETLADALRSAGGFTAEAIQRRVQVSRILPPNERDTTDRARVVIDVSAPAGQGGREGRPYEAFGLEAGDVVRAFAVSGRVGRQVMVKGAVWTPGVVGLTAGMRLSDAVRMAGGLKPDAYLEQVLVSRLRAGDSTRVQLRTQFRDGGGRLTDDVLLQDDDEVRVFAMGELKPPSYLAITGAVKRPGRYAYREGMTLRDLVLVAGGLEARAYVGEAEVATPPSVRDGGRLAESRRVPMDSSYLLVPDGSREDGASGYRRMPEVTLSPNDNVLIFAQPDWERPRRVTLTGEVRFPGTYTLLAKDERLSDVLQRAGGPTRSAYTGGVVFYRRQSETGRIGVDLPHVLRDARYRDNLLLQDGDSVHLPPYSGVVEVQGAVNAPRAVAYRPGAALDYYVHAAGGATHTGDVHHAYVTQPDGAVESVVPHRFTPDVVPTPKAGSVVYVTMRDTTARGDGVARLGVLAQVLAGLVTLTAILIRK